jgi:hypothetical protein
MSALHESSMGLNSRNFHLIEASFVKLLYVLIGSDVYYFEDARMGSVIPLYIRGSNVWALDLFNARAGSSETCVRKDIEKGWKLTYPSRVLLAEMLINCHWYT